MSLPPSLVKPLASLTEVAPQLYSLTNVATDQLRAIEDAIEATGVNLQVSTTEFDPHTSRFLRLESRRSKQRQRTFVLDVFRSLDDGETILSRRLWINCPLVVKVRAVRLVPQFIAAIHHEIGELVRLAKGGLS